MGKFLKTIQECADFTKQANKAKIDANLKKGMPVEKAVKKAYPKMSKKDVKRTVRLIKKQSITQGPNSTMNVHIHNSPRIQDNRGRRELAIQDNKNRGDFQDSHARKWAHGSYGEKVATISKAAAMWDIMRNKQNQLDGNKQTMQAPRNPNMPKSKEELERERILMSPMPKSKEQIENENKERDEERRKRLEEIRLKREEEKYIKKIEKENDPNSEEYKRKQDRINLMKNPNEKKDGPFHGSGNAFGKKASYSKADIVFEKVGNRKVKKVLELGDEWIVQPFKRWWNKKPDPPKNNKPPKNKKNNNKKNENKSNTSSSNSGSSSSATQDNMLKRYWKNTSLPRKIVDGTTLYFLSRAGHDIATNPAY